MLTTLNTKYSKPLLVLALVLTSHQASSTNIWTKPDPVWKGPYVGGFIGGAYANYSIQTHTGTVSDTSYFSSDADATAVSQSGTQTAHPAAFIGGIKVGDEWIWHNLILGAVLDYSAFQQQSSIQGTDLAYPDDSGDYSFQSTFKTDWLFTLRGRLGFQLNNSRPSIVYATSGMAMTRMTVSSQFSDNTGLLGRGNSTTSANQIGWTVGGGIECALTQALSLNAEYLYVAIPSLTTNGTIANSADGFGIPTNSLSSAYSTTADFSSHAFRIGLNYRFHV